MRMRRESSQFAGPISNAVSNHDRSLSSCFSTYSDTPVHATCHKMDVIELQSRHWTRMSDQTPMDLTTAKIPKPYQPIRCTACQCSIKYLDGPHEIGRGIMYTPRLSPLTACRRGCRGLSGSPQNIQGLHTSSLDQIPLPQCLVGRARY